MGPFDDVFGRILEAIVRLLYGIVRLIIRIIGSFLSQTSLVNHRVGVRLFGWWLAFAMVIYLLFGIVRAGVPIFWTPWLAPIYQWKVVLSGMGALLVGIAMNELDPAHYVPNNTRHKFEPDRSVQPIDKSPVTSTATVHSTTIVAGLVLVALIVGILGAMSSQRHEATLAEKLCAQADARISDGVE